MSATPFTYINSFLSPRSLIHCPFSLTTREKDKDSVNLRRSRINSCVLSNTEVSEVGAYHRKNFLELNEHENTSNVVHNFV